MKETKVNHIRWYLQANGKRDSNKFCVSIYLNNMPFNICLSFDTTKMGTKVEQHFWWSTRPEGSLYWDTKNTIESLDDETLDVILDELIKKEISYDPVYPR